MLARGVGRWRAGRLVVVRKAGVPSQHPSQLYVSVQLARSSLIAGYLLFAHTYAIFCV